ncbi:DUF3016 domain-containing protein [Piscinibacter gummiphilus]|uniref:Uncharacterized protein n=1 Tax=Piscinibacter gummiphilus TaxID=946333 RepID=A0A1W6L9Y9_9BURK|nr:DUF3016 domain-containing protein [Piscinibacter gummiphilus]ARN21111.1 hypothetical protein A4W93_15090 [Piscinibacter gummiphilus]ATU65792.1 DUF3016 domain-containing protein [Piscinibacter gummiphilus]GLS93664.1 hypothetical protein GCM10007918_09550 [Piscinibacter gummiphilus]
MTRSPVTIVALWLLAVARSATAAGTANVTFVNPEKFTDAGYSRETPTERDLAALQRDLERHVQKLAERDLADGETLAVEVLDVDLAGRFQPSARIDDVRIVRDIDWPRVRLRYTLSRNGVADPSVEERVSDQSFLMSINPYSSGDRLRYEKAMLDDWFRQRFGRR